MVAMLCVPTLKAQTYEKLWKQVIQAQQEDRPQTVVKLTSLIGEKAVREQNAPQLLKATLCRNAYRERLTPDSLYAHIAFWESWLATEENAVNRAILHSLLAETYADCLQKNRRLLADRIPLSPDEAPADLRQWTINLYINSIDKHALASVKDTACLLTTSGMNFQPLIEIGKESDYYRHDMLHLLAGRAVQVYGRLSAFGADSLRKQRVDLLHRMQATLYHRRGMDEAALLASLDLWQSRGGKEIAVLDSLLQCHAGNKLCAEVYLRKAQTLQGKYPEQALLLCEEGIKKYGSYKRIGALKNLRQELLKPLLQLSLPEESYPGDSLRLRVMHRNLTDFTLSLLRNGKKVAEHNFRLLPDGIRESDTLFYLPAPVEVGKYTVQVFPHRKESGKKEQVLHVTRLKVLTLNLPDSHAEYVVVDAMSGQPVEGAVICFYSSDTKKEQQPVDMVTTDAEGRATMKWQKGINYFAAHKDNDTAMKLQITPGGYRIGRGFGTTNVQVKLLTDRSIYRPGQTVFVKGIAYTMDGTPASLPEGKSFRLSLHDHRNKELASKEVKSNEFGSFSTEFVLPTACLNGTYILRTDVQGGDDKQIRVEAYKRPSFEVLFHPVRGAYKLGDSVLLEGEVKSFTGVALQEARLAYTVSRPWWGGERSGALASDTLNLSEDGIFRIPLHLLPSDERRSSELFRVDVMVIGSNGETQQATYGMMAARKAHHFSVDLPSEVSKEQLPKLAPVVENVAGKRLELGGFCRLYRAADMVGKQPKASPVWEATFCPGDTLLPEAWRGLPSGHYRLVLGMKDGEGWEVNDLDEQRRSFILFSENEHRLPAGTPIFLTALQQEFGADQPARICFGTSLKNTYMLMDIFSADGEVESRAIQLSDTLVQLEVPYKEKYGKGVTVCLTFVKEGKRYTSSIKLKHNRPDTRLIMKWSTFRDRLKPGQEEVWTLSVKRPDHRPIDAEVLALLYDASLDKLYPHIQVLNIGSKRYLPFWERNVGWTGQLYLSPTFSMKSWRVPQWTFDRFYTPWSAQEEAMAMDNSVTLFVRGEAPMAKSTVVVQENGAVNPNNAATTEVILQQAASERGSIRDNFAETAFFYPHLRTNEQGEVLVSFTMPHSLTRWNFRGYAHTKDMQVGTLEAEVVTAKEFMLTPNVPRYLRVDDRMEIAATITNLSGKRVKGMATLELFDPLTEKVFLRRRKSFSTEAGKSSSIAFDFKVTGSYEVVGLRVVADGGTFEDGEQHLLPVLSNKEFVTEALPIYLQGGESRVYALDSLFNRDSSTATHRRLTVEVTGNPAWYAVQALPSLSTPTTDNSLVWAAAYYAVALASHLVDCYPGIREVVDAWRQQQESEEGSFLNRLEANPELKNILLNETPWMMDAATETEQTARIASLFEPDRLKNHSYSALAKLKELQNSDGSWGWYAGMKGSRAVTTYVAKLLVRSYRWADRAPTTEVLEMVGKAFGYLQQIAYEQYRARRRAEREGQEVKQLYSSEIDYLYLSAIGNLPASKRYKEAHDYLLELLREHYALATVQQKAKCAIILLASGYRTEAERCLSSLKEYLVRTEEMGTHFAFSDNQYAWERLPITLQTDAMEALRMEGGNDALLDEMTIWLLRQKQVSAWPTSVSTADAIYALLSGGKNLLADEGNVHITLGRETFGTMPVDEDRPLSGHSYVKKSFEEDSPVLKSKQIKLEKQGSGLAWGAVYAQYLSPISDVKSQGEALSVEKQLYVERIAPDGKKTLQPLAGGRLKVGDKVVSRLTIHLDRAMSFVQLKDARGACFEPIETLSGYRWKGGIDYYQEVEDAACNFFFERLNKGVYVLEHSYRVVRRGHYEVGLATIRNVYAPEFVGYSTGCVIEVGE